MIHKWLFAAPAQWWLLIHVVFACLFLQWKYISEIKGPIEKQEACDKLFKNEEEEYSLYEALKFLMLNTAIELYNDDKNGRRVPVFSWLLFARDTSSNPCQLMHNHLNQIGHSGGLEQVRRECSFSVIFLLGICSGLRNCPAFVSLIFH